jgi:hypothetical protein
MQNAASVIDLPSRPAARIVAGRTAVSATDSSVNATTFAFTGAVSTRVGGYQADFDVDESGAAQTSRNAAPSGRGFIFQSRAWVIRRGRAKHNIPGGMD